MYPDPRLPQRAVVGLASRAEKHILIVDDDEDYRGTLVEIVSAEWPFAKISEVGSAEAAVELVRTEPAQLLIVDYRLPQKDGVQLVEDVRKIQPDAKFLMLSAEPDQYLLIKSGATVLAKPVQADVLTRMLRRLLAPTQQKKD